MIDGRGLGGRGLLAALAMLAGHTAWAATALPVPNSGVYLGIWANPNLGNSQEKAVEVREGPAPGGVNHPFRLHLIYQAWTEIAQQVDKNGVFQPNVALAGDISHGRVPVISWGCDQTVADSNHIIASGDAAEDAIITATATALKQYPGPVMLRWFWEFNQLNKDQSCRGDTGGAPTQQVYDGFVNAWKHIWTLFQNAGATNVVFLWNPGSYTAGKSDDPHGYYPGNSYVDWMGVDTYQRSATETFVTDFGPFYSDFSQSQYANKPLMVGENGSPNFAQNSVELQAAYLQGVLSVVETNRYPLLKAYDYFDASGADAQGNFHSWILDDNNGQGAGGLAAMTAMAASASFSVPPVLNSGSAANGATYVPGGLVPGSWAQVKGSGLSNVTRIWAASDFTGLGNNLPTYLSGVQVMVNNQPAAVYYIDSGQVSFQVPSGISGTATIQVITGSAASNPVTAAAVASAPGLFPNAVNGVTYPAAVFLDGKYAGDPKLGPAYRNAKPGDVIQLYATGLAAEPGGVLPTPQGIPGVSVTVGTVTVAADYAGLLSYAGEFQINFTVPQQFATLPAGTYPISIQLGGVSSPTTINTSPPGQIVLPIQH